MHVSSSDFASDLKFVEVEKVGVRSWQPFYDDVLVLKVLLHLSCVCVRARSPYEPQQQGSSRAGGRRVCKVLFLLAGCGYGARGISHVQHTIWAKSGVTERSTKPNLGIQTAI